MIVKEIKDKRIWEEFLSGCPEKTFLNSWNWGEFQQKQGNKIWRLGIYKKGLVGVSLAIKIEAKRGTFLFLPHGPNIKNMADSKEVLNVLIPYLKKIKAGFIRVAPIWQRNQENIDIFKNMGFKESPLHIHPEVTWELDIRPSEEEVTANMRKTTRYLSRKAERSKDINIIKSKDIKDLEKFNEVYKETAKRHNFVPFSLDYLRNQFNSFIQDDQILIMLGEYKGKVVSSAVLVYWQNIGFYHHGASLSEYRKIPVSYLLQWEAIREAKTRGCHSYNFWGIAPDIKKKEDLSKSSHPWAGITLFKMGFGGKIKEYVKTQDFPLSLTCYLTRLFEMARKKKRGL